MPSLQWNPVTGRYEQTFGSSGGGLPLPGGAPSPTYPSGVPGTGQPPLPAGNIPGGAGIGPGSQFPNLGVVPGAEPSVWIPGYAEPFVGPTQGSWWKDLLDEAMKHLPSKPGGQQQPAGGSGDPLGMGTLARSSADRIPVQQVATDPVRVAESAPGRLQIPGLQPSDVWRALLDPSVRAMAMQLMQQRVAAPRTRMLADFYGG